MSRYKNFLTSIIIIIFLIAVMSTVMAQPAPAPPPGTTYPPLPIPSPAPSPYGYTEEGDQENASLLGGMDSRGTMRALGDTDEDPTIRLRHDEKWHTIDVDFYPTGIEWAGNEDTIIFVSDNENDKVYMGENLSPDKTIWIEIGSPGSELGQFINPHGMFSHQSDALYVVDTGNNRIQFWNGIEWMPFESPSYSEYMVDICMFEDTTYITDNSQNCIYYKTPAEQGWNVIIDPTYINYPSYMDISEDGSIYFQSWVVYPEGAAKNIVRYKDGDFSVYVETGDGPGFLSDTPTSEEICLTEYGGLIYADSGSGAVYREKCSSNILSELSVNGIPLELIPSETNYEVILDYTVLECAIDATPLCRYSYVDLPETVQLDYGTNSFLLTCYSETGEPLDYMVDVIRDLSGNSQLSEIQLDGISLQEFDPEIIEYSGITYPPDKENVLVQATALNPDSLVLGTGTIELRDGENTVLLTVIAKDGINIQYYLLNIEREETTGSETSPPTSSPSQSEQPKESESPDETTSPNAEMTTIPGEPTPSFEPDLEQEGYEDASSVTDIDVDNIDAQGDNTQKASDKENSGENENWDFRNPFVVGAIILASLVFGSLIKIIYDIGKKRKPKKDDDGSDNVS